MYREVWGGSACVQALAAPVGEGGRTMGWGEVRWSRLRDAPVGRSARAEEGVGWWILVRLAWRGGCRVHMYVGQSRSWDLISSHFPVYLVHA
jgi:hypothetical protein